MKFDKDVVEPGNQVKLEVKADPGSMVNIVAVDKSILLLGNANDITVSNVSICTTENIEFKIKSH